MNDDRHVDRYVRITNRERFLIARALSLLADACDTLGVAYEGLNTTPQKGELCRLSVVFSEENWLIGRYILTDKILSVQTMTEQEKTIAQLCIAAQEYCNNLREEYDIGESYTLDCIEHCVEQIHRRVNPDFNDICETVEAFERGE